MILQIFQDAFFSAIAAIGFASLSNPPRRACIVCGLIAAVGHSVRFILMEFTSLDIHIVVATAIASLIIGVLCSDCFRRAPKCRQRPVFILRCFPMFPGIYAYRAFGALVMCLYKGVREHSIITSICLQATGSHAFFILLAMVAGAQYLCLH